MEQIENKKKMQEDQIKNEKVDLDKRLREYESHKMKERSRKEEQKQKLFEMMQNNIINHKTN